MCKSKYLSLGTRVKHKISAWEGIVISDGERINLTAVNCEAIKLNEVRFYTGTEFKIICVIVEEVIIQ